MELALLFRNLPKLKYGITETELKLFGRAHQENEYVKLLICLCVMQNIYLKTNPPKGGFFNVY